MRYIENHIPAPDDAFRIASPDVKNPANWCGIFSWTSGQMHGALPVELAESIKEGVEYNRNAVGMRLTRLVKRTRDAETPLEGRWHPMIPTGRPVIGKDLDTVCKLFDLLVADAIYLFRLSSMNKWMRIVRRAPELPVKDPTLALLVRMLDRNPDLSVIPVVPTPSELLAMIREVRPDTGAATLAIMLGCDSSSGYRWISGGKRTSSVVAYLMYYLRLKLLRVPKHRRAEAVEAWIIEVADEAKARDIDDVFGTGKWASANPKSPDADNAETNSPEPAKIVRTRQTVGKRAFDGAK